MLDIPICLGILTQLLLGIFFSLVMLRNSGNKKCDVGSIIASLFSSPQMFLGEYGSLVFSGTSGLFYYLLQTFELNIWKYLLTLSLVFMFSSVMLRVIPLTGFIPTGALFTLAFMLYPSAITKVIIILILLIVLVINLFMWFDGVWKELLRIDTYIIFEDFISAFHPIFPIIFMIITCFFK